MSNQELARLLRNVAAAYTIKDEKKFHFQIVAYQNAAETINGLTKEVNDYYNEGKLQEIPGIGTTLVSRLEELFKTGVVAQYEWALKDIPQSVFTLLDVPSFGPKKAYRLTKEFNLKNPNTVLTDLEKIAKANRIASLKGFGEKSQADILRAISEFKQGAGKTTRMTLPYAQEVADKIVAYMQICHDVIRIEPLGSLRRQVATVGDIDLAASSDNPKAVLEHFTKYPYVERIIEKGDVSSSILTSGGKQIDLLVQPPERFGSLLQHFTGSKNHNVHLRELALRKGLSLSEYGIKYLKQKGQPSKAFDTEEKFYEAIGLPWIPPEIREDQGEIEAAEKNNLPKLVELDDIKGDLHLHSSYPIQPSHDLGKDSFEEMIEKADELGYEYIGFSEHNPSQAKHTPQKIYEILQKRNEKIEQIKSDIKNVRIFKLLETDILPNGSLAIDNKCLDILDAAIVSVHSVFNLKKEDMTKRVIAGLSHQKVKILAHPTGRLLNQRPGYELDWEKIFTFCKANNKALEINSWPDRLDIPDSVIRMAVSAGVKMVINTDSHDVWQMGLMKYGISTARRGWATKNDILNTLSYNKFSDWLTK
ncbi:MAG: DNA polymerase/3'-5' exonuclease PolX [Candidatus Levyibacteriota bacterium]|jgi:DNA polymerase (family 10)